MAHSLKLVLFLIQRTLNSDNRIHSHTCTRMHRHTHTHTKSLDNIIELFLVILLRFTMLHYFTTKEPTFYMYTVYAIHYTYSLYTFWSSRFFFALNNWQIFSCLLARLLASLRAEKNADRLK